ncbi:MAG: hypothetical protein A2W93_06365 [Bacteroidetes bacterium GWF2_43_63]|nr:MAG: hypothetical protein A2W94_08170 [Bacteroidetes bacterium GWE2_42_42]OFY53244.1 MAG: hypothetical protein A2W93_06365 [Bacteroidetes bacterium GWF2_43_63]HBG71764.1 hypothetical protein [Bacteroidales bacterium]HCB61571.1 hypothetical protein [Bacteroidales bacterium]HCY22783.1 hypothetical protein [Bacteroidales bacterium]
MDEEKDIELAESYLLHRMTEQEAAAFEKRMIADEELVTNVEILRTLIDKIKEEDEKNLRSVLKNKEAGFSDKRGNRKPIRRIVFRAAAILILMLALFAILYPSLRSNQSNTIELATKYKPSEPGLPVLMDHTTNINFNEAMNLFRSGDFSAAGRNFNEMLSKKPVNDTLLYFSALCHFETNNYSMAEKNLKKLLLEKESVWNQKAEWWLALTLVAEDKKAEAAISLEKIQNNPHHSFSKSASALLCEEYFNK